MCGIHVFQHFLQPLTMQHGPTKLRAIGYPSGNTCGARAQHLTAPAWTVVVPLQRRSSVFFVLLSWWTNNGTFRSLDLSVKNTGRMLPGNSMEASWILSQETCDWWLGEKSRLQHGWSTISIGITIHISETFRNCSQIGFYKVNVWPTEPMAISCKWYRTMPGRDGKVADRDDLNVLCTRHFELWTNLYLPRPVFYQYLPLLLNPWYAVSIC